MKNILLIISLFAICVGVKGQTMKGDVRPEVLIETTMGNIRVELYNETPLYRDNFLKLIREDHFYDSLLFHRVIPDFMIQGGDPSSKNAPKGAMLGEHSLGYTLPAEIRLPQIFHKRGALAAAREPDDVNPKHESSSTQFYIVYGRRQGEKGLQRGRENLEKLFGDSIRMTKEMEDVYTTVGGTPHLDGAYTVFGQVVEGMDVVDRIQHVERDANDRPLEDVRIIRATILRDK
ncbi:peptidylprolyl isomerase [Prevotella sp. CAG:592]|uniref:peptidylprolyl isomerase n=1 Tax=Prevotella sp. CAG:592 TaxID=1262931 RepID=UPI00033C030E|nr:peptidylprolyl isomerase [Prevotella sp. CAG:592]CDD05216.1 peptidyl-prolyl cis-trans isomerase [Prevotella sp. CAG:592]